jgi:hypothetical protein
VRRADAAVAARPSTGTAAALGAVAAILPAPVMRALAAATVVIELRWL